MQTKTETLSPETLGPYTLIREIGRGGMSVVHQAVDRRTGKTVALKAHVIPPSLSGGERHEVLVRFEREARVIARLSHPGIVAIHEVGEQDGTHFLAMEYFDGETLRDRLMRGPLTPPQAAEILGHLAEALDAVHAAGIVHRDIKPSNVMLLQDGRVKLLDFGVARQSEDTTVTASHSIVGSPTYMAPEQVQGDLGGPPADVWALGILLYEMLSGHTPFEGASIPSVLYKVVHQTPALVPQVRDPVQQVVRRALEKNPAQRYATAHALAEAFQTSVLATRGIVDRDILRRWKPWAALLVAGVVLGTAVGTHHRTAFFRRDTVLLPSPPPPPFPLPEAATSAVAAPRPVRIVRRHRLRHHFHKRAAVAAVAKRPAASPGVSHPGASVILLPRGHSHKGADISKSARRPHVRAPRRVLPRQSWLGAAVRRKDANPRPVSGERPYAEALRPRPASGERPYAEALRPRGESSAPQPTVLRPPVVPRPQPTHAGQDPASENLQNLEKYIWPEGR